jgi:hypothetical protein
MGPTGHYYEKRDSSGKAEIPFIIAMVPKGGLEPPRVSPEVAPRIEHSGLITKKKTEPMAPSSSC